MIGVGVIEDVIAEGEVIEVDVNDGLRLNGLIRLSCDVNDTIDIEVNRRVKLTLTLGG